MVRVIAIVFLQLLERDPQEFLFPNNETAWQHCRHEHQICIVFSCQIIGPHKVLFPSIKIAGKIADKISSIFNIENILSLLITLGEIVRFRQGKIGMNYNYAQYYCFTHWLLARLQEAAGWDHLFARVLGAELVPDALSTHG